MATVRHRRENWRTLCLRADPDLPRETRITVEYEFSNGRKFERDTSKSGAYAPSEDE